jgi:hypothetical protein
MKIITNNSPCHSILKPIPPEWEDLRRKVASQAGRHAIIAGGAIRDHMLGRPVKDIDIFVLGMSAQSAKQIFGADTIEYAGVEEAKHQYRTRDGLTVDLVFSRYDNVQEILEHFDLGICRVGWDGWDYVVTDDFEFDRRELKITTFYPSTSGHRDRVLSKLQPIGFQLGETVHTPWYVAHVRELAARQGYRLMHRRKDQYWLMRNQPLSLDEIAERLQ